MVRMRALVTMSSAFAHDVSPVGRGSIAASRQISAAPRLGQALGLAGQRLRIGWLTPGNEGQYEDDFFAAACRSRRKLELIAGAIVPAFESRLAPKYPSAGRVGEARADSRSQEHDLAAAKRVHHGRLHRFPADGMADGGRAANRAPPCRSPGRRAGCVATSGPRRSMRCSVSTPSMPARPSSRAHGMRSNRPTMWR